MAKKSNILKIVGLGLLFIALLSAVFITFWGQKDAFYEGVKVELNQNTPFLFLDKKDIEQWLVHEREIPIYQTKLKDLDLNHLEAKALSNPWIENAEVYIDQQKMLNVNIKQRIPIARVFETTGESYYVDAHLQNLPLVVGYNYPVPIYTNVPFFNSKVLQHEMYAKVIALSTFIQNDEFWSAQISQIDVNTKQEFVLIPLVGTHKIHFGDTARMADKFFNLQVFYKEVLDKIGWQKYNKIDLRFDGQVVASPSLNKKAPKVDMTPYFEVAPPDEESDMPMETILQDKTIN